MASKKVTVVALFRAKPDKIEQACQVLTALLEPTRQEQGCINYDLHQNTDDPCRFVFYENWTSSADLDNHAKSDHLKVMRDQADELFADPIDVTLWEEI